MTISIQLHTTEDLKLIEPLLKMLQQFEVDVRISSKSRPSGRKKPSNLKKSKPDLTEHLHGVVQLPDGLNYKDLLETGLSKKYGMNG